MFAFSTLSPSIFFTITFTFANHWPSDDTFVLSKMSLTKIVSFVACAADGTALCPDDGMLLGTEDSTEL